MPTSTGLTIPIPADQETEIDHSSPLGDDFEALSRDKIPIRSMEARDLDGLIAIDQKITHQDRREYYERKLAETLNESAIRVSLVAENSGNPVGFIMARVDFGEFGRTEPEAVIDTIGVEPLFSHMEIGSAMMSQLMSNLAALNIDRVRTEVHWKQLSLLSFLEGCGFSPSQRLAWQRKL